MKQLKAFINKDVIKRMRHNDKDTNYLNAKYSFLCVVPDEYFSEFRDYFGNSTDDLAGHSYWILEFGDLKEVIEHFGDLLDDIYIYAIEHRIIIRYKIEELTDILDDWDWNETEFNGWPRVDLAALMK